MASWPLIYSVEARINAWRELQMCLHDDVHACNVPVRSGQAPNIHVSNVLWFASHLLQSKPAWAAACAPGLAPEQSEGVGSLWQCRGLGARGPGDRAWARRVANQPQSLQLQKRCMSSERSGAANCSVAPAACSSQPLSLQWHWSLWWHNKVSRRPGPDDNTLSRWSRGSSLRHTCAAAAGMSAFTWAATPPLLPPCAAHVSWGPPRAQPAPVRWPRSDVTGPFKAGTMSALEAPAAAVPLVVPMSLPQPGGRVGGPRRPAALVPATAAAGTPGEG